MLLAGVASGCGSKQTDGDGAPPKEESAHSAASEVKISAPEQPPAPIAAKVPDASAQASNLAAGPAEPPDAFYICSACHETTPHAVSVGPSLFGVFGRKIGSEENYDYSDSMRGHGGMWDEATLDTFLTHPDEFAPGTKMTFMGLEDPNERASVIAYLKTLK